jgi:CRISPR-associated protein Cmr4
MYLQSALLFMYAETPVHAGTGSGLGAVDLPIQRERQTGYPIVQSSGVKGALRQLAADTAGRNNTLVNYVFGPDPDDSSGAGIERAGAVSPQDARLLLFPVRALNGVFVWVTSPDVLLRFKETCDLLGIGTPAIPELPAEDIDAYVSDAHLLLNSGDQKQILLEEFSYNAVSHQVTREWANMLANVAMYHSDFWRDRLRTHLVILRQNDFRDFARYSTEIVTRIRLDPETKTVAQGALFTQELLPADSLLYSVLNVSRLRMKDEQRRNAEPLANDNPMDEAQNVLNWVYDNTGHLLQIGGDETVGRGMVRLQWLPGGGSDE